MRQGNRAFASLTVRSNVVPAGQNAVFSLSQEPAPEGFLRLAVRRLDGGPPLEQSSDKRRFRLSIPYEGCEDKINGHQSTGQIRPVWLVRVADPLDKRPLGEAIPVVQNDTSAKVLHFDLDEFSSFLVSN